VELLLLLLLDTVAPFSFALTFSMARIRVIISDAPHVISNPCL
jgi:hypothetical protein